MVSPELGTGTTAAVVSIHEEKNMEVEIPRYDPKDKPKLWISKVEIHHNTMMEKIRGLVQIQLFEQVSNNDDFFKGIEDVTIDIDNLEGQQKLETKEDILLAKKAQMLNDLLNAIMELPKEEILSFLTSSSLPTGIKDSSEKEPEPVEQETTEQAPSTTNSSDTTPQNNNQNVEPDADFNWLLDCGDSWKDLPAVVRVNAIQLGYNQTLWDEDAQDIPVFQILWKDLTPNQRTAAIFLGNYDEEVWNEDARILRMAAAKQPSLNSIEDVEDIPVETTSKKPKYDKEDTTVATAATDVSVDRFEDEIDDDDDDDNDDDDDDMFSEFVSNFGSDTQTEEESSKEVVEPPQKDEVDDVMMDEFLSNFAVTPEEDTEKESSDKASSVVSDTEDTKEEAIMDEFLSNFVDTPKEDETDSKTTEKESSDSTMSESQKEDDDDGDDEEIMDEFLSNFVEQAKEEESTSKADLETIAEKENLVAATSAIPKKEEDEEAMMDEFLSNFVDSTNEANGSEKETTEKESSDHSEKEEEEDEMMDEFLANFVTSTEDVPVDRISSDTDAESESLLVPSKSLVSNYSSLQENSHEDEEQPLVSKPKEYVMERGFQGEESPLLPSTRVASETGPQTQKPEAPPSTWETVSSYLYWIPVVIGIPVVYMVANGAQNVKA